MMVLLPETNGSYDQKTNKGALRSAFVTACAILCSSPSWSQWSLLLILLRAFCHTIYKWPFFYSDKFQYKQSLSSCSLIFVGLIHFFFQFFPALSSRTMEDIFQYQFLVNYLRTPLYTISAYIAPNSDLAIIILRARLNIH